MKIINNIPHTILFFILVVLLSSAPNSWADNENTKTEEFKKRVLNNISEEYVTCAAYYSIAAEGLRRAGEEEAAKIVIKNQSNSLQNAFMTAQEGRSQKMAEKVTIARLNLEMKSMMEEINSDLSNISILIDKYAYRCKSIMESPEKLIEEWTEKALKDKNNL